MNTHTHLAMHSASVKPGYACFQVSR